ncbi:hypothetical protein DPMN_170372 [Dreissena polymorpha]|uniref:Uncharacterized protein n=2 Tax=Dreissena polymorpha TaxID=45954 RepID=A0A9D4DZB7_DREPO|nr:hypothetical protein DPMN_170372 [Dreissena polymorpha]
MYEGFVTESYHGHYGSGANYYICLPSEPLWGTYDDTVSNLSLIYGAEFVTSESPVFQHLHNHEVPCVVCHVVTSNILMIPVRNACYPGWTQEYAGYLTATSRTRILFVLTARPRKPIAVAQ